MKGCPTCYRIFPEVDAFCPADGGKLLPYAEVPAQPSTDGDRHLGKALVGRYDIRRIVADGGMGRVYEARDAQRDARVAVKVLHPEVARDQVAVERFRREFEISHELPHDHIVEVYDFQEFGEREYMMAMEFLDGEELRTVLKRDGTIAPARVVRIMSQIACGLDEAHRREFVHRDLKPDNIFLVGHHDGDVVKLLDFGSARINKNRKVKQLTKLGTTIGSPFYMSPEQAQGAEDLDHRADVFALGAIAYECLSGTVPFSGANGPAILLAILTKSPPPLSSKANPALRLPPALDDVIDDALAKKPEMRTPTVGALADAIGKSFGLQGTHVGWAKLPIKELQAQIDEARASGRVGGEAVADPFAAPQPQAPAQSMADPFAAPQAPMQMAPRAAAMAMDDAFASAGQGSMEPAGVPTKSPLLLIGVIVGVIIAVIVVVVLMT